MRVRAESQLRRFIPARAGNASFSPMATLNIPVHPRACGERDPMMQLDAFHPVHPRACGERTMWITTLPTGGGSSPRVRGTRD